MQEILNIGSVMQVNSLGFLVNECDRQKIPRHWQPAVDEVISAYHELLNFELHSVYIRGSVPKGQVIDTISDLDTYAVTFRNIRNVSPFIKQDLHKCSTTIVLKYPFISRIEMKIYPVDKFLGDHINSALAFVAKTQSACLFGNDIRELIEAYKPSEKIAFHAKQLSSDLRVARQQCIENNTPKEIERLCGWVARRIVRSGFELTIKKNQDAVYTRDLIPCYRYFSFHFPQHSADMWRTVQLAINPTNDKYELLYLIDHFGSQLVRMVTLHLFA